MINKYSSSDTVILNLEDLNSQASFESWVLKNFSEQELGGLELNIRDVRSALAYVNEHEVTKIGDEEKRGKFISAINELSNKLQKSQKISGV